MASRAGIITTLKRARILPSRKKRASLARTHHIYYARGKGWVFRCTIDLGPKKVGKRVRANLQTKDIQKAIIKRDAIVAGFRAVGLTVKLRMQQPAGKKEGASAESRRDSEMRAVLPT